MVAAGLKPASPAWAYPSLHGPTGLVALPTADTAGFPGFDAAVDLTKAQVGGEELDIRTARLTVCLPLNWEVWALVGDASNGEDRKLRGFGGKLPLLRVPIAGFRIAAGLGWEELANSGDFKALSGYLVGTQPVPMGRVHVGFMSISLDRPGRTDTIVQPFAGAELDAGKGTVLLAELRMRDSSVDEKAVFSAALRRQFSRKIWFEVGTTNAGCLGLGGKDQNAFVGVRARLG
jgi:hypothetical protein